MRNIPMRAVNQPAGQETHYRLNSPLLFGALQSLDPEARLGILDLAPANGQLLAYFSTQHCKFILPGCRDALLALRSTGVEGQPPLAEVIARHLPLLQQETLDVILLWDLPNYLDKAVLSALIAHLVPHVHERSVLHLYLHTRQVMPAHPGEFRLGNDAVVLVELAAPWTATSPMYYQESLHRLVAPFRIERGMLLANGLQEYFLRVK